MRADADTLQRQAAAFDLKRASATLTRLRQDADDARATTSGPLWATATIVPVIGDDIAAARTVSSNVAAILDAAQPLETALPKLQRTHGRINVQALNDVAGALPRISAAVSRADAAVALLDTSALQPQLADGVKALHAELGAVRDPLANAVPGMQVLPSMLGLRPAQDVAGAPGAGRRGARHGRARRRLRRRHRRPRQDHARLDGAARRAEHARDPGHRRPAGAARAVGQGHHRVGGPQPQPELPLDGAARQRRLGVEAGLEGRLRRRARPARRRRAARRHRPRPGRPRHRDERERRGLPQHRASTSATPTTATSTAPRRRSSSRPSGASPRAGSSSGTW